MCSAIWIDDSVALFGYVFVDFGFGLSLRAGSSVAVELRLHSVFVLTLPKSGLDNHYTCT